jgi:tetratricopeptide (TPR) repeat protein
MAPLSPWHSYCRMLAVALLLCAGLRSTLAQTYKVGSSTPEKSQDDATQTKPQTQKPLGWGSNIQNARLARAAEMALKAGHYSAAVDYAQRAADASPNDPQLWFLLGYAARLARKTQLSLDAYNHGLRLSPSSLDGLSGLAQTYSMTGKLDEAERLLSQVVSADPKRVDDEQMLGEIYLRSGKYDQSLSVLGRAEQVRAEARTELLMALSYQRLKKYDEASRYLEMAKKRAPNNPEVERSLASFYRETGNYPAAIASLKAIAHQTPEITAEIAYTYQLYGRPDESAKLYARAADAEPDDLNLQLSAAQAEVNLGAIEAAQPYVKRASSLDEDHYRLHAIQGAIASLEERDSDAIHEYEAALQRLPASTPEGPLYPIQLHMNLVELYHQTQDDAGFKRNLDEARSEIQALDEHGPDRQQFLRLRALVKMNSGDLDGANKDVQEAIALNTKDTNSLQLAGDLLAKMGKPDDAVAAYKKVLAIDPDNRLALTSLGYTLRTSGHDQEAEKVFHKLATVYPSWYVPYLALGDMYTQRKEFAKAETEYRKGHKAAPGNSLIVAGGMNAAIEAHQISLAGEWLQLASPQMQQNPLVMREKERYLSFSGKDEESAEVGRQVIKQLPHDRDVIVYLAYDLLHMERYDELQQLINQYGSALPKEPDIPLIEGYIHKHTGQLEEAQADFTQAIERGPEVSTAYVNRGYIRNDLHQPAGAATDFETALRLEPGNGEAHLGLAYASLNLHHPRVALKQAQVAEKEMGDSLPIHLIRATAYGEEGLLSKSAAEYRTALKFSPDDVQLHLALANALYGLRRYSDAITDLQAAEKIAPDNGLIYAQLARSDAQLRDRDATVQNVTLAEQHAQQSSAKDHSEILVMDGESLNRVGDRDAAIQRFEQALTLSGSDRLEVRLAVARLMADENHWDDAHRQIALGMMEARTGETLPPTGEQFVEAADIFLGMHDFQLAQMYFEKAGKAGAPDASVKIGLANTYLAQGETAKAEVEISSLSNSAEDEPSYQYLLAEATVLRQEHQNTQALTAFAQAASAAGEDETAERELMEAAADEGLRINSRVSVLSDFSVSPIFEDTTVYPLDARLDVPNPLPGRQGLLPPPRSSIETQWTGAFHLHFADLPGAGGFFQIRNAQGQISLPSADAIVNRDTTDYTFNFGLNPSVHLGRNTLTFSTGIQETIRRDSEDPVDMNQNLFRQFVYLNTSSFFNLVSLSGYAIRETGPFTESSLHSRDLSAAVDFRVGRPWGKNAFLTGWGARDVQFTPIVREFYYTSAYAGIERRFSEKLDLSVIAEDLRAWRVEGPAFAIAQALRPAGRVLYSPTRNWSVQASVAYSRNMAFHAYDAVQSGFSVGYAIPFHRTYRGEGQNVEITYPIRFAAGLQQEDFFNFTEGNNHQLRPYVSLTIF